MEDENTAKKPAVTEPTVNFPDHGTELAGEHGTEVVVHDKDEEGNVVGWHKQPVDTEPHPVGDGEGQEIIPDPNTDDGGDE